MRTSSLTIPKEIEWSVEDWRDFYETLRDFRNRVMKRAKYRPRRIEHEHDDNQRTREGAGQGEVVQ